MMAASSMALSRLASNGDEAIASRCFAVRTLSGAHVLTQGPVAQ
jgi:hypothetical protein